MTAVEYFSFGLALFILAIKPGPNFIAIANSAMQNNVRATIGLVFGMLIAETFIMSLALLSYDISSKYQDFVILFFQSIGAMAFLWLGIISLRKKHMEYSFPDSEHKISTLKKGVTGFFLTIGNPFSIIFFGSLLPTFMDVSTIDIQNYLKAVSAIWIYEGLASSIIILLAIKTAGFLKSKKMLWRINFFSALLLILIGLYMMSLNFFNLMDLSKTVF